MSGIKYNEEQIQELERNKYVRKCSSRYITFTDEFKIKWLELNKNWKHHKEIFKEFWFPEYIINSQIPKDTFDRLRYQSKHKWILWKKWRKKKEKIDFENMTKDEELEYLRAKVAYYEEIAKYLDSWLP